MLIENTKIAKGDVVTFKMKNGDEVIARVEQDPGNNTTFLVSRPQMVVMAPEGFGLIPYALTLDPSAKIIIDFDSIFFFHKTIDTVAKEYIKQTTGLVI